MNRRWLSLCIALVLALLAAAPATAASADSTAAALAGVIRDVHGVPQMGALVQLLTADATTIATAFTDAHGRYLIPSVRAGSYQLRASAAFFVPASRPNVRLHAGAQAIINLTMSTLYETENWLPATRRRADEAADDWKWTLRSSANRPLLRLTDPADHGSVFSSSAEQQQRATTQARITVSSGDGAFGQGGVHQVLILNRSIENGDSAIFRADLGGSRIPFPVAPAAEVSAGYERRSPFGGNTRLVTSVQSHPELAAGPGPSHGSQIFQIASTQQWKFGDSLVIDAGSLARAEHLLTSRFSIAPFASVTVRPASGLLVEYRFASSRDLQSSEDLDRPRLALHVLADSAGRPLSVKGSHHELTVSRKFGTRIAQISAYSDHQDHAALSGTGLLSRVDLAAGPLLTDGTTGTFFLASSDLASRGAGISLVQPLTESLSLWFAADAGTALTSSISDTPIALAHLIPNKRNTYAVSAAVRGKIVRTSTAIRAEYRYQPERSLTAVNTFNTADANAYLSMYLRQRILAGRFLPEGLDFVIEATNLLEQGYHPLLANDGHLVFLSQAPRAIQGGFAFNF